MHDMKEMELLRAVAERAIKYRASLTDAPVLPTADPSALRESLGGPTPEHPSDPAEVVRRLADAVEAGGLMAYAVNMIEFVGRAASSVDKILKGAKPANLPVEQPTKFELIINLKAAKALGITFPQSLLLRADEVIQ